MKCLLVLVAISAFAVAELPPSKSYLPPPSASRGPGYQNPQSGPAFPGAPQVIAARNLEQGGNGRGNSFSRSSSLNHSPQGRSGVGAGYDENAAAFGRNSIDANAEPANYNFGYSVNDFGEGTDFGHHEERVEEKAQGEYHVVLPDGRKQTVSYEADERGFKPQVSYEDSEDLTHSNGYDANANTRSNGYDANANTRSSGYDANANTRSNGYDTNANTRSNGYDATANTRSSGYGANSNGYDTIANTRSNGYDSNANTRSNGYDSNASTRNHGHGFKNGGHNDEKSY